MRVNGLGQKASDPGVQKVKSSGQDVPIFKNVKGATREERPVAVEERKVSNDEIFRSIERANEKVMVRNTELHFSVHEKTKAIMIKVMNSDTQEVIREIPSEQILDMVANFMELAGLYIDEKA